MPGKRDLVLQTGLWVPDHHLMANVARQQNCHKQNQQPQHHVSNKRILRSVCNIVENNNAL